MGEGNFFTVALKKKALIPKHPGQGFGGSLDSRRGWNWRVVRLLLAKRRHRYGNAEKCSSNAYSAYACVGRCCADSSCPLTFGRPEHISEHAGGRTGAIRQDRLNVCSGLKLDGVGKVHAFGQRLSGDEPESSRQFRRSHWRNRRAVVGLPVDMLLPAPFGPGGSWQEHIDGKPNY